MVRLRKATTMALFKSVGIKVNSFPEAEAWICVLKTAVAINSEMPMYDSFIYKSNCFLKRTERCDVIELCTTDAFVKCFKLRFASKEDQEEFIEHMGNQMGRDPPPQSSATPSPPSSEMIQ